MNQHQFEQQPSSPRTQRMTEDEAKAVIDLWQQEEIESGGLTTRPAVPDVAEGLGVSIEDVQRLLQKVRVQRQAEEKRLAHDQYELELERIRLAEEERGLAEVQRQRAELQRRCAETWRMTGHQSGPAEQQVAPLSKEDMQAIILIAVSIILLVVLLLIAPHPR